MSRWGKNRNATSYALPLDALVKEKENTNRPVAARSAGTVGKWGITSFTSIRARPVYGFASFSPNQDPSLQYSQFSPKSYVQESSHVAGDNSAPANNNTVKPKKFFKSRNSVAETNVIPSGYPDPNGIASVASPSYYSNPAAINQQQSQSKSTHQTSKPPAKTKKKKKPLKPESSSKKSKVEKVPKPENLPKPPKPQKLEKVPKTPKKNAKALEKIVEPPKPTRVLSRARKVVNYSEDKSRSPTPGQHTKSNPIEVAPNPVNLNELVTSPIQNCKRNNLFQNEEAKDMEKAVDCGNVSEDSPPKLPIGDHPPIVLRISKGTSRLISTDSEGISGSPPYLSPDQQNAIYSQPTAAGYSSAAASLLAVLSDDPEPQDNLPISTDIASTSNLIDSDQNTNARSKRDKLRPKAEPIKLKIKTTTRAHRNTSEAFEQAEEAETQRGGRATRRIAPYQPIEDTLTSNTSPNHTNYQSPHSSLTNNNSFANAPTLHPTLDDIESFRSDELLTKLATSETENQNDYERGIVPKKRRVKNKANSEVIGESKVEPIQKKQRGRRRNDDNFTETIQIGSQSSDTQTTPTLDNFHELEKEPIPKKRMTAAARKQYSLPIQQLTEIITKPESEKLSESNQVEVVTNSPKNRGRRVKSKPVINSAAKVESMGQEEKLERQTRSTRNNANDMMQNTEHKVELNPPTRSYGRKRKLVKDSTPDASLEPNESSSTVDIPYAQSQINIESNMNQMDTVTQNIESESVSRGRLRRQAKHHSNGNNEEINILNNNESVPMETEVSIAEKGEEEVEKPSVKLVISKKKGSIFKSRAIDGESGESKKQKRHVYKHKWDVDDELDEKSGSETKSNVLSEGVFQEDSDIEPSPGLGTLSRFSRTARTNNPDDDLRIRNVKKAHQMQEIGEFQEMDDDVEYILESLKSQSPIATRNLAAIQLASKCMTPAFRMHVRAHGTATKFFSALHDATQNQSLGLCTATIMFVLIQDNLNMDLDKHSLELMLNLLDSDISRKNNYRGTGLSDEQTQRNEQKVIEICREIKNQGKAEHLNLDNISIGTLAMETLLTLTSKRAGEWFKDEMRTLGGLEHIINTICECCKEISDCVIEWTESLLEKLKKIERCLRVLENVSDRNEDNQKYILYFRNGEAVETLSQLYKLCVSEIEINPTNDTTPTGAPGTVLREALVPLLKVLINLTHTFNRQPKGAVLFGEKPIVFETCFYILFQTPQYIPDKCIFELSLLVLLLLINLSGHMSNRTIILDAQVSSDTSNKRQKIPGVQALIGYFYKYEELARFVEQNTDDILNNPEKSDKNKKKNKSQEDVEETVSKLLQKAGNHMEHTFLASYVCLLVGHLIMEEKDNESKVRMFLRNKSFADMIKILETYYNFMNLTASSEAIQVAHMKETKRIIQFMKESDQHSNEQMVNTKETAEQSQQPHPANTSENRWASSSSSSNNIGGGSGSNLFNKLCNSGR